MRGLREGNTIGCGSYRYNPAYAGTTALYIWCPGAQADTTPRMRGLPVVRHKKRGKPRYNPAYAGTTSLRVSSRPINRIQPRVCGDYGSKNGIRETPYDTTPRMRGLPAERTALDPADRYNPAYAGTTTDSLQNWIICLIQPRVCGDYSPRKSLNFSPKDTTPRMRGLRRQGLLIAFLH